MFFLQHMTIITSEISYDTLFEEFCRRYEKNHDIADRILLLLKSSPDPSKTFESFLKQIQNHQGKIRFNECKDIVFLRIFRFVTHTEKREKQLMRTCDLLSGIKDNKNPKLIKISGI